MNAPRLARALNGLAVLALAHEPPSPSTPQSGGIGERCLAFLLTGRQ